MFPVLKYDQDNLAKLCPLPPILESEYHIQNQLYGHNDILRRYAQLPKGEPLPWLMEHFVSFEDEAPYCHDVESPLNLALSVNEAQARALASKSEKEVLPIGSFFHYARCLPEGGDLALDFDDRRGTIVFPDKSTQHKRTIYDREKLAEDLASLPDEFQPVFVSIFWKDYLNGDHEPFEKAGLKLFSFGHSYDPLFLFRQYDLLRQVKYSCANEISTSFIMSVLAGCRFFYLPTGALTEIRNGKTEIFAEEPSLSLPGKKLCLRQAELPLSPTKILEQRALAERFSGMDCLRKPEFFQDLFERGKAKLRAGQSARNLVLSQETNKEIFFSHTPCGIDSDGWLEKDASLFLGKVESCNGLELRFDVPTWWKGAKLHLKISVNERDYGTLKLKPGRLTLPISFLSGQTGILLRFEFSEAMVIPGEWRERTIRLCTLRWLSKERLAELALLRAKAARIGTG